jgi:hypothetical protein
MTVLKKTLMAAAAVAGLGLAALKAKVGGSPATGSSGAAKRRSKTGAPKSGVRAKKRSTAKTASKGRSTATKPVRPKAKASHARAA